jgi:hypothetical protein
MEIQMIDFKQANALLGKIRKELEEEEGDGAAWGPDSEQPMDGHLSGMPGVGGAMNVSDVSDALDKYLSDMTERLMQKYDLSEDEAADFVLEVADNLASVGMLADFPDEDAPAEEVATWYAKAGSIKFDAMVMTAASREYAE